MLWARERQAEGGRMTRYVHDEGKTHPLVIEDMEIGLYRWCRCGKTMTVPFCDGHHQGSGFTPLKFVINEPRTVELCACGLSQSPPFCDNSHLTLE
jgi:CDGSH-type Zn-finger protein